VESVPQNHRAKKLRAADLSWEAPPSPVKTTISSPAIIAHRTASQAPLRSPKRVKRLLLKSREDASPKASTHRSFQSLTRFTLIYPSCSVLLFGNDRATKPIGPPRNIEPAFWPDFSACDGKRFRVELLGVVENRTRSIQERPYNRTIIARCS